MKKILLFADYLCGLENQPLVEFDVKKKKYCSKLPSSDHPVTQSNDNKNANTIDNDDNYNNNYEETQIYKEVI